MSKKRLMLTILISLVLLIVVAGAGVKYSSRPAFCSNCHEIAPAVASYQVGNHANVSCLECHADQGEINIIKRKIASVGELYIHFTNAPKPEEIKGNVPNYRCLECHSGKADAKVQGPDETKFTGELGRIHKSAADYKCADCHLDAVHPRAKAQ